MKIGIIGGTGLDNPDILRNRAELKFDGSGVAVASNGNPADYGQPSDVLITGLVEGVECVLLARHGRSRHLAPSSVNYRANLLALKQAGCDIVIGTHSVGSLCDEYKPGDFVLLDQLIDRTQKRRLTYYDNAPTSWPGVCHTSFGDPYDVPLRSAILSAAAQVSFELHTEGTCIAIEGPRFSSRAESLLYKSWGAHVIGMTQVPEAQLAKELDIPFCAFGMVTDYDAWKQGEKPVSINEILVQRIKDNGNKMVELLKKIIPILKMFKRSDQPLCGGNF